MEDSIIDSSNLDNNKPSVEIQRTQDTSIESAKSVSSNHYMSHD